MVQYSERICHQFCVRTLHAQNGSNYFQIKCSKGCSFQITYNYRESTKSPRGYYLVKKSTNLSHSIGCSNTINQMTFNPNLLADKIVPLFETRSHSIKDVGAFLKCLDNSLCLTKNQIKYIRSLAKKKYFRGMSSVTSQIVDFAQELSNKHQWKLQLIFDQGVLTTIVLFAPWAKSMILCYSSPFIVDTTFTEENLSMISGVVIDGEHHTQLIGVAIRSTETHTHMSLSILGLRPAL